jgi:hypothetical protein
MTPSNRLGSLRIKSDAQKGHIFKMMREQEKRLVDEWLLSSQAAKMFFGSTILVLALLPVFVGRVHPAEMPVWARTSWTLLGMAGTFALFLLWLGMWRYWVQLDDSKAYAKRLWFVVLLFGFWYGSCIYYYFVYLPQVIRRRRELRL